MENLTIELENQLKENINTHKKILKISKNINNVIFASPSKSRIRVLQSIGRGLRKSETKNDVTLYDISDDLSYKNKKNFTLKHFEERINIYNEEEFDYRIDKVNL